MGQKEEDNGRLDSFNPIYLDLDYNNCLKHCDGLPASKCISTQNSKESLCCSSEEVNNNMLKQSAEMAKSYETIEVK